MTSHSDLKVSRDPDGTIDEVFADGWHVHVEMIGHDEAVLVLTRGERAKLFNIIAQASTYLRGPADASRRGSDALVAHCNQWRGDRVGMACSGVWRFAHWWECGRHIRAGPQCPQEEAVLDMIANGSGPAG